MSHVDKKMGIDDKITSQRGEIRYYYTLEKKKKIGEKERESLFDVYIAELTISCGFVWFLLM